MYVLRHEQDLSERLHKELTMVFLSRKGISVAGGTDKRRRVSLLLGEKNFLKYFNSNCRLIRAKFIPPMWCRGPELRNTLENWSRSGVTRQSLREHIGIPT